MTAITKQLIPIAQVIARIPPSRGGCRTSPSTVARWIARGVMTPTGRIRLRAVRLGGRWFTDELAWEEFIAAQTAAALPADTPAAEVVRGPAARRKASEEAARELEAMGC